MPVDLGPGTTSRALPLLRSGDGRERLGVLAVGLVLCFYGTRSLQIAVLASGFALGWLVAEGLGAQLLTTAVVAIVVALAAWAVTRVVFGAAVFFVGALAGGVVGAKLFGLLQQGEGSVVLAVLFVAAMAFVAGVATQRFRGVMLAAACALGGAGLALSGLARAFPQYLGFLRVPTTPGLAAVAAAVWLVLAVTGWVLQRRTGRVEDRPMR